LSDGFGPRRRSR